MKKEEKATAVAELAEKFGRARLAILTESVGLPVNQVTELRKQLRGAKAEYRSSRTPWRFGRPKARSWMG